MFFSHLKNKSNKILLQEKFAEAVSANESSFNNKLDEMKDELKRINEEDHYDLMHSAEIPCPFEWIDHLAFWFLIKEITSEIKD